MARGAWRFCRESRWIFRQGSLWPSWARAAAARARCWGCLPGWIRPAQGEIWLDGVPIHNLAETELAAVRGRKIGFVFQSYQLIQTLTALENVLLPYELNR